MSHPTNQVPKILTVQLSRCSHANAKTDQVWKHLHVSLEGVGCDSLLCRFCNRTSVKDFSNYVYYQTVITIWVCSEMLVSHSKRRIKWEFQSLCFSPMQCGAFAPWRCCSILLPFSYAIWLRDSWPCNSVSGSSPNVNSAGSCDHMISINSGYVSMNYCEVSWKIQWTGFHTNVKGI